MSISSPINSAKFKPLVVSQKTEIKPEEKPPAGPSKNGKIDKGTESFAVILERFKQKK